jgi:predicted outer membrane protein
MRKMRSMVLVWMSVVTLGAVSCDRPAGGEKEIGSAAPRPSDGAKGAALRALHEANQQNVRLSQMAQDRAQAPEVRRYAAALVRDGMEIDNRLLTLAKSENVDLVPLPEAVPLALSRAVDKLERGLGAATGRDFDAAYVAPQVFAQEYVAGIVVQAEKASPSKELSTLLSDAQRQATEHVAEARRLASALGYQSATGGGPIAGTSPGSDSEAAKKDGGTTEKASHLGAPAAKPGEGAGTSGAPARKDAPK